MLLAYHLEDLRGTRPQVGNPCIRANNLCT